MCVDGNLDEVVGVVHLRDLLDDDDCSAGEVAAPMPVTSGVLPTLREMQRQRSQMTVVVNEHGGAEGIVTVEDLVQELVGEIYDETDRDILAVRREADGTMVIPGGFPVHDLVDLGIEVPRGDYATLAGYLLAELQRIPEEPGDTVRHDRWVFTVTRVEDRVITEVHAAVTGAGGHPAPSTTRTSRQPRAARE